MSYMEDGENESDSINQIDVEDIDDLRLEEWADLLEDSAQVIESIIRLTEEQQKRLTDICEYQEEIAEHMNQLEITHDIMKEYEENARKTSNFEDLRNDELEQISGHLFQITETIIQLNKASELNPEDVYPEEGDE